jgi:hypothetical protein
MNNLNKTTFTIDFFKALSKDNLSVIDGFYAEDIIFIDPIVSLSNITDLRQYYKHLYEAVISISFDFVGNGSNDSLDQTPIKCSSTENQVCEQVFLAWNMNLKATGIKSGKEIVVSGCSHIIFNDSGKAKYHRDYYDMGEFVYEQIPLLSSVIKFIKKKLVS